MILVRLDITNEIGTGHFRRMNVLANYLLPIEFLFLIITDDEENAILRKSQVFFTNRKNEFNDIKTILNDYDIDILIFDLLHYEKEYLKQIKKMTDKKIVSFHEHNDNSKNSDLAINYNLFEGFENNQDPQFLSGYKYIIFNDEIENYRSYKKEYVFVSFGGSDPTKLTLSFIDNIANKLLDTQFLIHVGNFNTLNINKIFLQNNVQIIYRPENLFKHMAGAKLAIIAGGNMMYEFMYLKTPSIVIAHNEHQEIFALNASKYNCVEYFGKFDDINYDELKNLIQNKISNYSNKCEISIDNQGKERIKQSLLKVILA
jgi:spore coat polysaccharide biosynthesis predicted glycosyltransferase SpsG